MPRVKHFFLFGIALVGFMPIAKAEDLGVCGEALIKSTYWRNDSHLRDWRLAQKVTRDVYDEVAHDAKGQGVIYGVPVGANYGDFQKNVEAASNNSAESLTDSQAQNVMWTGLNQASASAYSACISAAASQGGLSLFVSSATDSDIALILRWRPRAVDGAVDPSSIGIEWSGNTVGANLPSSISEGDGVPIVVPRPEKTATLAVKSGGIGSYVTLTPLPPMPPPFVDKRKTIQMSANAYDRPNSSVEFGGPVSPCLHNSAPYTEKANYANYTITGIFPGRYLVEILYYIHVPRPVTVSVNGEPINNALAYATYDAENPSPGNIYKWWPVGAFDFYAGSNSIQISRFGSFPHICSIRFSPR